MERSEDTCRVSCLLSFGALGIELRPGNEHLHHEASPQPSLGLPTACPKHPDPFPTGQNLVVTSTVLTKEITTLLIKALKEKASSSVSLKH